MDKYSYVSFRLLFLPPDNIELDECLTGIANAAPRAANEELELCGYKPVSLRLLFWRQFPSILSKRDREVRPLENCPPIREPDFYRSTPIGERSRQRPPPERVQAKCPRSR